VINTSTIVGELVAKWGSWVRTGKHDYLFVANAAVEAGRFNLDVHTNSVSNQQLGTAEYQHFYFVPTSKKNNSKCLRWNEKKIDPLKMIMYSTVVRNAGPGWPGPK
jgi:hypothetical protein